MTKVSSSDQINMPQNLKVFCWLILRRLLWQVPDYFQLKTEIFHVSMFPLLFSMKFDTELENYQYDSFK